MRSRKLRPEELATWRVLVVNAVALVCWTILDSAVIGLPVAHKCFTSADLTDPLSHNASISEQPYFRNSLDAQQSHYNIRNTSYLLSMAWLAQVTVAGSRGVHGSSDRWDWQRGPACPSHNIC